MSRLVPTAPLPEPPLTLASPFYQTFQKTNYQPLCLSPFTSGLFIGLSSQDRMEPHQPLLLPRLCLTLFSHSLFSSHCALPFIMGPTPSSFLSPPFLVFSLPPEALPLAPTFSLISFSTLRMALSPLPESPPCLGLS